MLSLRYQHRKSHYVILFVEMTDRNVLREECKLLLQRPRSRTRHLKCALHQEVLAYQLSQHDTRTVIIVQILYGCSKNLSLCNFKFWFCVRVGFVSRTYTSVWLRRRPSQQIKPNSTESKEYVVILYTVECFLDVWGDQIRRSLRSQRVINLTWTTCSNLCYRTYVFNRQFEKKHGYIGNRLQKMRFIENSFF